MLLLLHSHFFYPGPKPQFRNFLRFRQLSNRFSFLIVKYPVRSSLRLTDSCPQTQLGPLVSVTWGTWHNPFSKSVPSAEKRYQCSPESNREEPWLVAADGQGNKLHLDSQAGKITFGPQWWLPCPVYRRESESLEVELGSQTIGLALFPQSNWLWSRDRQACCFVPPACIGFCLCCLSPWVERKKKPLVCFPAPEAP